jgi:uncharacterized protein
MISRIYVDSVREMLDVFPVVAVVGSRQVGKTTLVTQTDVAAGRHYVTLDDLASRRLAESDPEALVSQAGPITIDEVQLAPELLRAIKKAVDCDRRPGRFLVTGSADLNVLADLSHVLAGAWVWCHCHRLRGLKRGGTRIDRDGSKRSKEGALIHSGRRKDRLIGGDWSGAGILVP